MIDTQKLKSKMEVRFMSGVDLARHIGVTETTIYNITAGRTQPKPENLRRICEALECKPEEILK